MAPPLEARATGWGPRSELVPPEGAAAWSTGGRWAPPLAPPEGAAARDPNQHHQNLNTGLLWSILKYTLKYTYLLNRFPLVLKKMAYEEVLKS
jgi:hypothetical protein